MGKQTWDLIVEPEKPILLEDLETVIEDGPRLQFPISRAYEMNLLNQNWNAFIWDMAKRMQPKLEKALRERNKGSFEGVIRHIASISSMYRLNRASLEGTQLTLEMAITDFKDYIGTTQHALVDPDFRQRLLDAGMEDAGDPNHYFANPLATNTNLVTSDGKTPLGMRSETVAIYPGVPHVIGGYVKVNGDNKPDFSIKDVVLFDQMRKELSQEIGLSPADFVKVEFLGICRNLITRGPEAMYNIELNIPADELHHRWETISRDKFEHRNITFYTKEELKEALDRYRGKMVPSGEATLTLFMQHYG